MPDLPTDFEKEINDAIVETDNDFPEEVEGTSKENQEDAQQEVQEDTQEEIQEDTQETEQSQADTLEDSKEDTQEEDKSKEEYSESEGKEKEDKFKEEEIIGISDIALTRAVNAGLTVSEARSFSNEENLNGVVGRLETQNQQYRTWAQELQTNQQQTVEQLQEEQPVDLFADLPKLNPEDYDPEVVKFLDGLTDIARKQQEVIQDFQANQDNIVAANYNAGRVDVEDWFDKEISNLGADFEEIFGTGNFNSLNQNSVEYQNRDNVAGQLSVLIAGYNAQGINAPQKSDLFQTAVRQIFHEKYAKIEHGKLENNLKKQEKQHIRRVNKSKSIPSMSPEEIDKEIADAIDSQFGN